MPIGRGAGVEFSWTDFCLIYGVSHRYNMADFMYYTALTGNKCTKHDMSLSAFQRIFYVCLPVPSHFRVSKK